ncbi:hypothetical protein XBI1_1870067 [Xenorhabdus bovienii str. Intermedium]|uniref:Uncharacterized protein n=1 Tax=Xenorhabdus bovienii str. Intermedium TaxID=1379677 RepID=A0A077QIC7_XENBV|nr:hypothetical protein XBI1_1870067 [Xenorhabdus bovienii str. Intermedium]
MLQTSNYYVQDKFYYSKENIYSTISYCFYYNIKFFTCVIKTN